MARTKSLAAKKHREILKEARGFKHARSTRVHSAMEALLHAGQYAYAGRRIKRRDLRALWILRINAGSREAGMKYSELIAKLKSNKIELDRKILADIAYDDLDTLKTIISELK